MFCILGAVYLEKGLGSCQKLLAKFLFWDDEVELSLLLWLPHVSHLTGAL